MKCFLSSPSSLLFGDTCNIFRSGNSALGKSNGAGAWQGPKRLNQRFPPAKMRENSIDLKDCKNKALRVALLKVLRGEREEWGGRNWRESDY